MGKMKKRAAGILAPVREILRQGHGKDNRVKGKCDYVRLYRRKWKQCLAEEHGDTEAADENFEDSVNAEEVAGYYIAVYGRDALVFWRSNTQYKVLSEQDREVDRILTVLYGEDRGKRPGLPLDRHVLGERKRIF